MATDSFTSTFTCGGVSAMSPERLRWRYNRNVITSNPTMTSLPPTMPPVIAPILDGSEVEFDVDAGVNDVDADAGVGDVDVDAEVDVSVEVKGTEYVEVVSAIQEVLLITISAL